MRMLMLILFISILFSFQAFAFPEGVLTTSAYVHAVHMTHEQAMGSAIYRTQTQADQSCMLLGDDWVSDTYHLKKKYHDWAAEVTRYFICVPQE